MVVPVFGIGGAYKLDGWMSLPTVLNGALSCLVFCGGRIRVAL